MSSCHELVDTMRMVTTEAGFCGLNAQLNTDQTCLSVQERCTGEVLYQRRGRYPAVMAAPRRNSAHARKA